MSVCIQDILLKRANQDLDVALPLGETQTPQDGLKTIRGWSAENGLTYIRQNPKGPLTLEVFFSTRSGFTFPVEVCKIPAVLNDVQLLTAFAGC